MSRHRRNLLWGLLLVLHVLHAQGARAGRSYASPPPPLPLGSARWLLPGGMPRRLSIRGGQDVGGQGGEAVVMAHDGAGRVSAEADELVRNLPQTRGSLTPGLTPGPLDPGVADGEEMDDFPETEMEDLERDLEEAQDARAVAEQVCSSRVTY